MEGKGECVVLGLQLVINYIFLASTYEILYVCVIALWAVISFYFYLRIKRLTLNCFPIHSSGKLISQADRNYK